MTNNEQWLRVEAGGRAIEVLTAGDPDGFPVLFHSGTPSAAVPRPSMQRDADRRRLRLLTYSRPGYAESSPRAGRTVASCVEEVRAIVDALGIDEFVTFGQSGGGPHALATVAQMPDRCLAAATVAGAAPGDAEGLDFVDGMGPENVEEFSAAVQGGEVLDTYLLKEAVKLAAIRPGEVADALGGLVSDVDRAAITGEYAESLALAFGRSVSSGIAGWRDDDLAFVRPWGFALDSIRRPVAVWQGDQDRMVPFEHGRWLGAHLPGAHLHLEAGEGHLSLTVTHLGAILDDLLRLAGREPAAAPSPIP